MSKIRIGTCGFRGNKIEYAKTLYSVEVQHTFYQPPQISTLERWRASVPDKFEFALKAWQLITHEAKSPTYRRLKRNLTENEKLETGSFKWTEIVCEALETTFKCAEALKARTVLFQCPASFEQTTENIQNLEKFFSSIKRGKMIFAWEPRGRWNPEIVKSICADLDLWHTVDPFKDKTQTPGKIYFRLHGRTGWRYKYEESELEELAAMLPKNKTAYVFFNNIFMTEDALRLQSIADNP
ncbi:MAG: DUF72 domain-containing protein [Acidobacteriota bacterium]|nr:DUF72 domain-containing protein [Acidobacteriota bacterium]